jgi:hypothetical protein
VEGRRQSPPIGDTYQTRLAHARSDAAHLERRHATLAWVRLAVFLSAGLLMLVMGSSGAPWLSIPIVVFIGLMFVHARVLNARDRANGAIEFYERGIARLEDRWQGQGETGERFRDPAHLYADDLDLFGRGSLFQLLSTTRTASGEQLLAQWLKVPAAVPEIRDRQAAIAELSPKLDLREQIAVLGPEIKAAVRTDELIAWATAPALLTARWPRIVLPLLATVSASLVGWWIWTGVPPGELVLALVVQSAVAGVYRRRAHEIAHGVEERQMELEVLAELIARLEQEPVESPLLRAVASDLRSTGRSPAEEIKRLARLVDLLSSAHNPLFAPIAALFLLGTQVAFAVERWRVTCGPAVPRWLAAVAQYEALSALAAYTAEHPGHPFPELVEEPAVFEGDAIAHPLLPRDSAVANDVRLSAAGVRVLIVSGSNMSGKTTFLRTVGINAVLAYAGGPVRASRLRLSILAIGGTLRIHDSLQEGRSRFFAEISRISEIVALAKLRATSPHLHISTSPHRDISTSPYVLFLFDELLSGTNSHDRLLGATGILRGLVGLNALGLVTTHDLALTAIVDELDGKAQNAHFEDRFVDGTLHFDYTLKPGVVRTSNAIALMRSVGLDV